MKSTSTSTLSMRIVAANLKLFYQRRGLWVWYFLLLILFLVSMQLSEFSRKSHWANVLIIMMLGEIVADSQKEMFSKPFAFLLPWHKECSKHIIFGVGFISSLVWAIVNKYMYYPDFPPGFLAFVAIFLTGLALYLIGVWSTLPFRISGSSNFFLLWILAMSLNFYAPIIQILLSHSAWTIFGSIALIWFSWRWINPHLLGRKLCGEMFLGFPDAWNFQKMQTYYKRKQYEKLAKADSPSFDRLLEMIAGMINVHLPYVPNRFIAGNLFLILSKLQGFRWWVWPLFLIGVSIYFGYMAEVPKFSLILFLFPILTASQIDLIPHRSLLTSGGRTEKFYAAMVLALFITVLITVFVAAAALMSVPLSHIMPDISIEEWKLTFHRIDIHLLYLTVAGVPLGVVIGTLFGKKPLNLLWIPAALGAMFAIIYFQESLASLLPTTAHGEAALIAIAWAGCAVVLNHYCRRKDLLSQGR